MAINIYTRCKNQTLLLYVVYFTPSNENRGIAINYVSTNRKKEASVDNPESLRERQELLYVHVCSCSY